MNNPAFNSGSIAVLALTLPYIPRQTYPINHLDAQVGLSRVNYYADPLGLLVLLGPYQGQASNETGRLYLNNLPLALSTDVTKDAVTPLEFRLPVGMLSNGINTLKCTVTRQSGNEDSAKLVVLHYLADPAGNDPDPDPGNSLLSIDVNPKSVGPAEAAAGVRVILDYPGKQLYDSLSIDCGGKVITHQIAPTLQDPNPETKPIVRTLYAADFAHAPNDPQFAFKYNVISQVGDFSGTSSTGVFNPQKFWSKSCLIDVHLDRNELEMPILREILTENNDDPAVVDLDKMKGGPLWALIHLIQTIWQAGDEIHLMFTAVVNGSLVAAHEATLPITQVPGQFAWDIPNDKVIADSIVSVHFEQIRGGKVIGVSKVAEAQVIGKGFAGGDEDWEEVDKQLFWLDRPVELKSGLTVTVKRIFNTNSYCSIEDIDPRFSLGSRSFLAFFNSAIRFSWNSQEITSVELTHLHNSAQGNKIEFYDQNGDFIEERLLPVSNSGPMRMVYKSPSGRFIGSFVWNALNETDSGAFIDYIKWK
ncbi:hypothetical protein C5612_23930 [Pseudomonas frederiksbergensis]|uniref:Uncharacterized protein n=1 Tax=Pseudomonas frederiksbergensis TaxID=104087 RepID=A0A2S8HC40_9PSED|nr:hypothetical protein [Pseudomonas frederiksbergensis]PQP00005.1 hypothetical protein C5612_23930 [Pseudomonas frederiksbergensis]